MKLRRGLERGASHVAPGHPLHPSGLQQLQFVGARVQIPVGAAEIFTHALDHFGYCS